MKCRGEHIPSAPANKMVLNRAFINNKMVTWGRERLSLEIEELATKLHVKETVVRDWESGDALPTFLQARKLARALRIPFGYLYLTTVPVLDLPLPDLRTVPSGQSTTASPDLIDLLNDVLLKQQWYRDYLELEEAEPVNVVGKFNHDSSPDEIAADVQANLEIDNDMRRSSTSWSDFLTQFVRKVEDKRILVMRSGIVGNNGNRKLDVDEFRGFAISDVLAPLIFINTQDAVAARIFTLAHELAHLWIGVSGVSLSEFDQVADEPVKETERICDSVAAEILMPRQDFMMRWQYQLPIEQNVQDLAHYYRVSTLAILRQAHEQSVVDDSTYWQYVSSEIAKQNGVRGGGGDFYNNLFARNGGLFTTTLLGAVLNGRVTYREAAQLLTINVSTVRKATRHAFGAGVV